MLKNLKESRRKMKNYSIKNSNAFTLIELLAVIIILAVIALIATPVVLNVVDKAKIKSNMNSVYGIADAAKLYHIESQLDTTKLGNLDGKTNLFEKSEFIYGGGTFDNKKSSVKVTADGKIGVSLYFKGICYTKDYESNDVTTK
ncbi:MAG: prepilin-type N-terminal cleavage/methylation domain-containing protein, partial [Bacilli bacterium]